MDVYNANEITAQFSIFKNLISPINLNNSISSICSVIDCTFYYCKGDKDGYSPLRLYTVKSIELNKICAFSCSNAKGCPFAQIKVNDQNGNISIFHLSRINCPNAQNTIASPSMGVWDGSHEQKHCNVSSCSSLYCGFHHDTLSTSNLLITHLNIIDCIAINNGVCLVDKVTSYINSINIVGIEQGSSTTSSVVLYMLNSMVTLTNSVIIMNKNNLMKVFTNSGSNIEISMSYIDGDTTGVAYSKQRESDTIIPLVIQTRYCGSYGASVTHSNGRQFLFQNIVFTLSLIQKNP